MMDLTLLFSLTMVPCLGVLVTSLMFNWFADKSITDQQTS